MHPDNIYTRRRPDFARLMTINQPSSKEFISKSRKSDDNDEYLSLFFVDFKDPEKLRQLSCSLLLADFNLKLSLLPDRLCPIIPGRLDYCLVLIDILKASIELSDQGAGVLVIDIGTGSSAIYPLLFSRLLPNAKSIATEVDQASYNSASQNVIQNNLQNTVTLHLASITDPNIFPISLISRNPSHKISIAMCNPPFYSSAEQIESLRAKKEAPPEGICTGSEVEMICLDGEVGFIINLIRHSLTLKNEIRWFTSLCGKYTTLSSILPIFRSFGGNNYAIIEMMQGRTRRWVFGWSWQYHRLPDAIARSVGPPCPRLKDISQMLPPSNHLEYYIPPQMFTLDDQQTLIGRITTTLELAEKFAFDKEASDCICSWKVTFCYKSWSRGERRKRKFGAFETPDIEVDLASKELKVPSKKDGLTKPLEAEPILIVKLALNQYDPTSNPKTDIKNAKQSSTPHASSASPFTIVGGKIGFKISTDFLFGKDTHLFQSFWNHVLQKIRTDPG